VNLSLILFSNLLLHSFDNRVIGFFSISSTISIGSFAIYVAPCGVWLPWEPTYYKLNKVDYLEPELNRLHEEKIKNEILAKNEFDKRIKDAKRKAIEENIESARKSGNKLTQTLDVDGNLVGVNTMDFDDREISTSLGREQHEASIMAKKH
jgi:Family of unknown function (DUF5832)